MPILDRCSYCDKTGRYADKETDKICAKCKHKVNKGDKGTKEEKQEEENLEQ